MKNSINFQQVKENIECFINEHDRIPNDKEIIKLKIISDQRPLNKYFRSLGYNEWADYYREKGYKKITDIKILDKYKSPKKVTIDDLKLICLDFYDNHNKYPTSLDFNSSYNQMPSFTKVTNILSENNITWFDFLNEIGCDRFYPNVDKYDEYIYKFKSICNQLGRPLKYHELLHNEYELPTTRWFVEHCPNKDVKDYNQFLEYIGYIPRYNMSKDLATKLILELQNKLDRPLMLEDFIYTTDSDKVIGISTIKNYWGTMNKMKEELGLEIVQESMIDRQRTREDMICDMKIFISQLGRLPSTKEINKNKSMVNACTYHNYFGGINNVFLSLGYVPNKKDISQHLTNEEIVNIYKEFVKDLDFTPTHDLCKKIYELPSPRTVIRRLNCSWNEFVETLGCIPNTDYQKGSICYAKDNSLCFSSSECFIHNYFLDSNINIIAKEYFYRNFVDDYDLKEFIGYKRCDWVLQQKDNFYIVEYFGLKGNPDYDKRHDQKIEFIKKVNLQNNFIAIYPKDINKLENIFKILK